MKSPANADSTYMNRRTETRFQVYSRAQLILLDRPELELNVSLTDLSGAGFQVLADEALPAGTTIVIETDAHLILGEVRHSRRRGERYAIGAQRLHTLAKLDVPEDADRIERVRILIDDHHLKQGKAPSPAPPPPAIARQIRMEPEGPADNVDIFEPRPSSIYHAIPRAAKPPVPRLIDAPARFIRIAWDAE